MNMQFLPGSLEIDNKPYDLELWRILNDQLREFSGYCAYKIPVMGTSSPIDVPSFIIVTQEHGIILIDVVDEKIIEFIEDGRFWNSEKNIVESRDLTLEHYRDEIESRFKRSPKLYSRKKREISVSVKTILIFRENSQNELDELDKEEYCISTLIDGVSTEQKLQEIFNDNSWDGTEEQFDDILSLIEGTWDYRSQKTIVDRSKKPETMNDFIQLSLNRTFKQDNSQRQVSMQIPSGPQRIRGLAGTGKTVVLCLKAALTALRAPQYKILYLFNTQSLYNSIESQIGDYYAKESKKALPKESIDVLHAWGGRTTGMGLYLKICLAYGLKPLTLRDTPRGSDALAHIYKDLETNIGSKIKPIYDMVLIDEAQDFPNEVFEIVYRLTKKPKRVVVAYDDFQSLKSIKPRDFHILFGKNRSGDYRFSPESLGGEYAGGVAKDFVLPNCYRNPRNLLMIAHGIAIGVKRNGGVVDSVDKIADWNALGYQVNLPKNQELILAGDLVEVERLDKNSCNQLEQLITEQGKKLDSLLQVNMFKELMEEVDFISEKIDFLINSQGVSAHEIFVIAINTRNSEAFLKLVRSALNAKNIMSIMPGFVESARHFYEKDRVVLTTPFKAKGNEANIVFVANCETVTPDASFNKRNSFFVSVTRSRGWCYISGTGENMLTLEKEIQQIKDELPKLTYTRPTEDLIGRRRLILSKSSSKAEKTQKLLESIASDNPELLKEFYQQQFDLDDIDQSEKD